MVYFLQILKEDMAIKARLMKFHENLPFSPACFDMLHLWYIQVPWETYIRSLFIYLHIYSFPLAFSVPAPNLCRSVHYSKGLIKWLYTYTDNAVL